MSASYDIKKILLDTFPDVKDVDISTFEKKYGYYSDGKDPRDFVECTVKKQTIFTIIAKGKSKKNRNGTVRSAMTEFEPIVETDSIKTLFVNPSNNKVMKACHNDYLSPYVNLCTPYEDMWGLDVDGKKNMQHHNTYVEMAEEYVQCATELAQKLVTLMKQARKNKYKTFLLKIPRVYPVSKFKMYRSDWKNRTTLLTFEMILRKLGYVVKYGEHDMIHHLNISTNPE